MKKTYRKGDNITQTRHLMPSIVNPYPSSKPLLILDGGFVPRFVAII